MHQLTSYKLFYVSPVVLLVAACAAPSAVDGVAERTTSIATDCFTVSQARDFRYLDDHNLIVYAPARVPYHLELSQTCFGLRGNFAVGLRSRTDQMCGFAGDSVVVNGSFPERCSVLSVRRLDEDQLAILVAQFENDGPSDPAIEVEVTELPQGEEIGDQADP